MNKAKKEKKHLLAVVFLLNNYYYVRKTIQNSELWSLIENKSSFLQQYDKAISDQREIYKGSWKKAIECINLENYKPLDPTKKSLSKKEKSKIKSGFQVSTLQYQR